MVMSKDNITLFLDSIKNNNKETTSVYLPSKRSKINLTALNLKQQKDIIACVADGVAGLISFSRILNSILIDASGLDDLLIIDRAPAIIGLRAKAHGYQYKTDDKVIDLNTIIDKLSGYSPIENTEEVIEYSGIKATVGIPTLSQENSIILKLEDEVNKNGDSNTKNLGSIYIYEIIKFVRSLEYDSINISFDNLPIKERINILEGLPFALNKLIIKYIEDLKEKEQTLLTVDDTFIDINPSFFDVE